MLRIEKLLLPNTLPLPEVMKSWKENKNSYDPEFWEFQYEVYRYLGRISDTELFGRYNHIVRNMRYIVSNDRNIIPILSFLSSWYWYRKEHQTRYEFFLRKIPLDQDLPQITPKDLTAAPKRPRHPNSGDVLFRYGSKKWLHDLVKFGRMRISAAQEYAALETDPARQDDELTKNTYLPGEYTTLTTTDGKDIKIIGDMKQSVSGIDYYVYCTSCDWDPDLFKDFNSDCCVVINNPEEFARRLKLAATSQLSNWYFHHCPIEYFDAYERTHNQHIDNAMSKDLKYAYQREYRFIWASFNKGKAIGHKYLELGPLSDIAEIYDYP